MLPIGQTLEITKYFETALWGAFYVKGQIGSEEKLKATKAYETGEMNFKEAVTV